MKTSTRLACLGIVLAAVSAAAGCDDDDGNPPGVDAGPDAAGADAGSPTGSWRLISFTTPDGTQTDIDTPVGGIDQRVNGTLQLDPATGEGAYTHASVVGDRTDLESIDGLVGDFLFSPEVTMLNLGGDVFSATYASGAAELLTLVNGSVTYVYERLARTPTESVTVGGLATIEAGTPALTAPRVGLVSLLRGGQPETLDFIQVSALSEPGIDVALGGGFGDAVTDTGTFTLVRGEGALGVERIGFGDAGFASVCVVVAYEDRDGNGAISRFVIDACVDPGVDCIRGLSPLVLSYRAGDSPELLTAGYGFLPEGWALGNVIEDSRSDGLTILPLDPTTEAVPVDVEFRADPTTVEYPPLRF